MEIISYPVKWISVNTYLSALGGELFTGAGITEKENLSVLHDWERKKRTFWNLRQDGGAGFWRRSISSSQSADIATKVFAVTG